MGPEIVNRNKGSIFHGDYVGRDNIAVNIVMLQDSEREFVVTHNANIKPVSYFTGRETELQELRQRIEAGRKSVLVSGMGGIGKTHICRKLFEEYLNKHAGGENGPFRYLGYIEYNGDMGSSLQNCLKFKQQDSPEQNQEAAWRELEYLAADGKLLLFVDNVDRLIGEDSGLQRLKGIPGAVVLTSRQISFGDEFEPYRIGFLGMEQCKEIYEKIRFEGSGKKVRPEEVLDLEYVIENLVGRHTITVELLAHLARTKIWTVKRLKEELEQKGFRLTFHKDGELVNIQESYEVLYDLSELTEAEKNILEAFSVFPYIPLAAETCNEWLLADAGVSEDDDILMGLYQKGWLQFDIEQESFALHPVFAQFIYEMCKPEWKEHKGMVEECQKCIEIPKSGFALESWENVSFAESIIEKMNMEKSENSIKFVGATSNLIFNAVEYEEAGKLHKKFLETTGNESGAKCLYMIANYRNLIKMCGEQQKEGNMKALYKRSLQISEKVLGNEYSDMTTNHIKLPMVYNRQREYEKVKGLYKKSLEISEEVLGVNHVDTATNYNNLAMVHEELEEYDKAEELYKKSLGIREKVLGVNHPDTATSYFNLAAVYEKLEEYDKAEELYKKSLGIREKVLGENHPDTATNYFNLAEVYEKLEEYHKAEELCQKGLKIREDVLGEEHPATLSGYMQLSIIYSAQGKWYESMQCFYVVFQKMH